MLAPETLEFAYFLEDLVLGQMRIDEFKYHEKDVFSEMLLDAMYKFVKIESTPSVLRDIIVYAYQSIMIQIWEERKNTLSQIGEYKGSGKQDAPKQQNGE